MGALTGFSAGIGLILLVMGLLGCSQIDETEQPTQGATGTALHASDADFQTLWWADLLPEEDEIALANPPDYLSQIVDGSEADQLPSNLPRDSNNEAAPLNPYEQALISTRVIEEMDGRKVRVPGFVVPLEFNEDQIITQFFLVPYFGACIHQPPPPPNQIILVDYEAGFELPALYDPFWISGVLETRIAQNQVATSAYSMQMLHYEPYTD